MRTRFIGLPVFLLAMALLCGGAFADVYVAATGSDEAGDGSAGNPYRTITKALPAADQAAALNVNVGPGTYGTAAGEVFPLTLKANVSVIGTMGPLKDATDSTIIDAGAAAKAFVLGVTPLGKVGAVKNCVVTNFELAFDGTGWRGTIDNCYVTGCVQTAAAIDVMFFYHGTGELVAAVSNTTVKEMTNTKAKHFWRLAGGTGSFTAANCILQNITGGQPNDRRGFFNSEINAQTINITITDTLFDNIKYTAQNYVEAGMIQPSNINADGGTFLMDRCEISNINLNTAIVSPNRMKTNTVRNTLFHNVQAGVNGAVSSFFCAVEVRNCTFDACSSAFYGNWGSNIKAYNCGVSNCDKVNTDTAVAPVLYTCNVFNTPVAGYNAASSTGITDYDPKYIDDENGNYHLRTNSRLIDAGNNTYVNWTSPVDKDGRDRILDGDLDGTATADIGAYEFDPDDASPSFTMPFINRVYEQATVNVPVSIVPPAGAEVVGAVTYGDGVSGPATLTIGDGAGPVNLAVTANAGAGSQAGARASTARSRIHPARRSSRASSPPSSIPASFTSPVPTRSSCPRATRST